MEEQTIWTRNDGFTISTNKYDLDTEIIFQFLNKESYWVKDIPKELVISSIQNSTLCYGIFVGNPLHGKAKQIGFARVVSDLVRFSWLGDVFVLPEYRGKGLGKWLINIIVEHPKLKGTSFNLGTKDAHLLYAKYGFKPLEQTANRMVRPLNWESVYDGHGLKN